MLKKLLLTFAFSAIVWLPTQLFAIEYDENFNPNKLVSDYLMYNSTNTMDVAAIQNFLLSKNSYLAQYSTEDAEGNVKSAAEIIYDAAQTYQINPQAVIVLLQKEQGLIQKSEKNQKRLDWATGYAVCDSCSKSSPKVIKYKGFGKQVDNGAGALRFYKENMDKYNFIKNVGQAYQINNETVIPENYATAALYTYTPHILGNYNFWRIWQRYFGNPLAESPLDLEATVQTDYMAQIIDSASPNLKAQEGEDAWYWVEFLNIGTKTWYNEDLASMYLLDASKKDFIPLIDVDSSFEHESIQGLITNDHKINAQRRSVAPGEVLRVTIPISAKYEKTEQSSYVLVLDKKGWLPGTQVSYELTRQFNYDAELIDDTMPEFSEEHTTHRLKVEYKNVGLRTWYQDSVYLDWNDQTKKIQAYIPMDQDAVPPGETATFSLITKIKQPDTYNYDLKLVKQISNTKYNLFPSGRHKTAITVKNGFAAQVVDLQVPNEMQPGQEYYATILVKNTGGITWTPNEMVLRSYSKISPFTRSGFYHKDWHSGFAIEKIPVTVEPGDSYSFNFFIKAPAREGTYKQYYQLEWGDKYMEIDLGGDELYKLIATDVTGNVATR